QPAWYTLTDAHGVARWPAVPLELGFNAIALAVLLVLRQRRLFPGQLFHLYLMAYGLFRVAHEIKRDTLRMIGPVTGYQIAAGAVFLLGLVRYQQRGRAARLVRNNSAPPVSNLL
ncbi:MAG TPA: prolipoprotein diacylglyceryl transferase family protein, partial [Verrucomicrobiae bacterium]|nr:prolipoprotein diacylglyceryl transferase family protein [Verrucomicrobiae bacterium]